MDDIEQILSSDENVLLKIKPNKARFAWIGNIVGSNIFNILFVLGITGTISPILFKPEFLFDGIFAVLAILMLMLFGYKNRVLKRWAGICFLTTYVVYIFLVI